MLFIMKYNTNPFDTSYIMYKSLNSFYVLYVFPSLTPTFLILCYLLEPAVGIDLGTTYSCVAEWQEQHCRVEIIHNDQGNRTTPSCVAFKEDHRLIGDAAKNQAALNPTNTVFGS